MQRRLGSSTDSDLLRSRRTAGLEPALEPERVEVVDEALLRDVMRRPVFRALRSLVWDELPLLTGNPYTRNGFKLLVPESPVDTVYGIKVQDLLLERLAPPAGNGVLGRLKTILGKVLPLGSHAWYARKIVPLDRAYNHVLEKMGLPPVAQRAVIMLENEAKRVEKVSASTGIYPVGGSASRTVARKDSSKIILDRRDYVETVVHKIYSGIIKEYGDALLVVDTGSSKVAGGLELEVYRRLLLNHRVHAVVEGPSPELAQAGVLADFVPLRMVNHYSLISRGLAKLAQAIKDELDSAVDKNILPLRHMGKILRDELEESRKSVEEVAVRLSQLSGLLVNQSRHGAPLEEIFVLATAYSLTRYMAEALSSRHRGAAESYSYKAFTYWERTPLTLLVELAQFQYLALTRALGTVGAGRYGKGVERIVEADKVIAKLARGDPVTKKELLVLKDGIEKLMGLLANLDTGRGTTGWGMFLKKLRGLAHLIINYDVLHNEMLDAINNIVLHDASQLHNYVGVIVSYQRTGASNNRSPDPLRVIAVLSVISVLGDASRGVIGGRGRPVVPLDILVSESFDTAYRLTGVARKNGVLDLPGNTDSILSGYISDAIEGLEKLGFIHIRTVVRGDDVHEEVEILRPVLFHRWRALRLAGVDNALAEAKAIVEEMSARGRPY